MGEDWYDTAYRRAAELPQPILLLGSSYVQPVTHDGGGADDRPSVERHAAEQCESRAGDERGRCVTALKLSDKYTTRR